MTDRATRVAALTVEVARLEGSVAIDGRALEALRRELAALRAELADTEPAEPEPGPRQAPAAGQSRPAATNATDDFDEDQFDDVPV